MLYVWPSQATACNSSSATNNFRRRGSWRSCRKTNVFFKVLDAFINKCSFGTGLPDAPQISTEQVLNWKQDRSNRTNILLKTFFSFVNLNGDSFFELPVTSEDFSWNKNPMFSLELKLSLENFLMRRSNGHFSYDVKEVSLPPKIRHFSTFRKKSAANSIFGIWFFFMDFDRIKKQHEKICLARWNW